MAGKYHFERMLTPQQVAELFAVDPKTVTRWARAGRMRSVQTPGGHRRFRASDVEELLGHSIGGMDDEGEPGASEGGGARA